MNIIKNYKSVSVNTADPNNFKFTGRKVNLSVGIDVGKDKHYVALYVWDVETGTGTAEKPWTVTPRQIPILAEKLSEIAKTNPFKVGMESSGTYGDPLRQALTRAGLEVLLIRSKYVHDMKESADGSPSKFDSKDATIIAKAVSESKGVSWGLPLEDDQKTKLEYVLKELRYLKNSLQQHIGHMEAEFGRFWVTWPNNKVPFHSPVSLKYLSKRGGPPEGTPEEIEQEIRKEFSGLYSEAKLNAVIEAAQKPCGIVMNPSARDFIRSLAKEMLEIKARILKLEKELDELAVQTDWIPEQMLEVLGKTAASSIMETLGDPRNYRYSGAFLKAMGLNLVESSSGKHKGQVHISKRGNPEIRRLLYMSALRLVQLPQIKPWYEAKKKEYRGKNGQPCCTPALIAVIRKVLRGLHYAIFRNEPFDPSILFRVKNEHPSQELPAPPKQSSSKAKSQQKGKNQRTEKSQQKEQVIQKSSRRTKLNWPAVAAKKSTKQAEKKEQEVLLE